MIQAPGEVEGGGVPVPDDPSNALRQEAPGGAAVEYHYLVTIFRQPRHHS